MKRFLLAGVCLLPMVAHAQGVPDIGAAGGLIPLSKVQAGFATKQDVNGDISGQHVTPSGTTNSLTLAAMHAKNLQIESFAGLHADGVTDNTTVIQTALNLAASSGSNRLTLGPFQYLINSANLVIPPKVTLACTGGAMGENEANEDYSTLPCTIRLNPAYTIQQGEQSSIDGVNVLNSTYVKPTNLRGYINLAKSFSGIAIYPNGGDTSVKNSTILGFAYCIQNNGRQRQMSEHVYGDCTNGMYTSQSHDISRARDIHMWPFLTAHSGFEVAGIYPITGLADNGSHLIRATFTPQAEPPVTGDRLCLRQTQGVPYSARGCWTVTVIDATHFDLQGSVYPTGTVLTPLTSVTGSCTLTAPTGTVLNQIAGPGMLMAGGGLATGNTTILQVYQNILIVSPCVTTGVTAQNFQVAPLSVAGGTALLDPDYRNGRAFDWNHSENLSCDHCFEFGHEIGFHFDVGAAATDCTACGSDNAFDESSTSRAIDIAAGAHDTHFTGGFFDSKGTLVYVNDTLNGTPTIITGAGFSPGSLVNSSINALAGSLTFNSNTLGPVGYTAEIAGRGSVYVATGAQNVIAVGNNLGLAKFATQAGGPQVNLTQGLNVSGGGP